jgi:ABC-type polar amino acid transport system ATPase subunit
VVDGGELKVVGWKIRRDVVLVPQGPSLLPHLTALENIALPLEVVRGLRCRDARAAAEKVANQLGVTEQLQSYPEELSGGQLQRVQLARAMVLNPAILMLDEVTMSLDPLTIEDVVEALFTVRSLSGGPERAIILVTHLLGFSKAFADRIALLHAGAILEGPAKTFPVCVPG